MKDGVLMIIHIYAKISIKKTMYILMLKLPCQNQRKS